MARRKKPDTESSDDSVVRHILESISDTATRSEKVSWERKMDNMVSLIAKLRPIEDQIGDLITTKRPIMDEIAMLRKEMVRDCVHPYTNLLHVAENTARCKFCERQFAVMSNAS